MLPTKVPRLLPRLATLFTAAILASSCVYRSREFVPASGKGRIIRGWEIHPSVWAYRNSGGADRSGKHTYTLGAWAEGEGSAFKLRIDSVRVQADGAVYSQANPGKDFRTGRASFTFPESDPLAPIAPGTDSIRFSIGIAFMPLGETRLGIVDTVVIMHLKRKESSFVSFPSH